MRRVDLSQAMLFDPVEFDTAGRASADFIASVEWSHTRRSLLEQCPRRYYYAYYGANKRAARDEPDKETLHRLKEMSNRHTRSGKILHRGIASFFRKMQAGERWTLDRMVGWARQMLRADIVYSQADPDGLNPQDGSFPPVLLHEFHYRWPEALPFCVEAEERLVDALTTFYCGPAYTRVREIGCTTGAKVETKIRIGGLPCRAEGVIDLHYLEGEALEILDWKSGIAGPDGDDSLQLSAYGLWGHLEYGLPTDRIGVCKGFLGSGHLIPYTISDLEVAAARARILQDCERMAVAHEYVELSGSAAFTPCVQPEVCRMCPYLRVCREGKECVDA